jgi:hypothetical protein
MTRLTTSKKAQIVLVVVGRTLIWLQYNLFAHDISVSRGIKISGIRSVNSLEDRKQLWSELLGDSLCLQSK